MAGGRGVSVWYRGAASRTIANGIGPKLALDVLDPRRECVSILARSRLYPNQVFTISQKLPASVRTTIVDPGPRTHSGSAVGAADT